MFKNITKPKFIKNIILTGQINRFIILVVTGISASIFVLLSILTLGGVIKSFFTAVDFLVLAILSVTGIYGMYEYFHVRKIYKIDTIFPDFVRDLAESRRAGMTFTKAILFASKG
ncbi:MAG: hypothetical protein ACOC5T_08035, partial [Elusimicrobiota bacterium]